ncbi:NAD(P)H-dependent oxidoreductase [Achromobacter spanius]|uniref:NAD(P)H-dependent oxidoreductase n=1 Tax=Achromobacter spanius TaxID=217203 RepID=UPI003208CC9D
MNVLIVFAHPEPASFCGALRDAACQTLADLGHRVQVSDLYRMDFSPVGDVDDFEHEVDDVPFEYQREQRIAHQQQSYCAQIAAEHEKLLWCDVVMLNFPLWWFGPPAILKGWIDRVMSVGFAYDSDRRFEKGALKGRNAMVTITTGSPAERFSDDAPRGYADLEGTLLPLQKGLFPYVGMGVLPPFAAYAVARVSPQARSAYLQQYRDHLAAHFGPARSRAQSS